MKTRKIVSIAIFVMLMAVSAQITIPFPLIPLTFQSVVAITAGLVLGAQYGAFAMLVYCAAGLLGLPMFASFGGGAAYVLKPSFGYIIGFIVAAFVAGWLSKNGQKHIWISAFVGLIANYAVGLGYQTAIMLGFLQSAPQTLVASLLPTLFYFVKDTIFISIIAIFYSRISRKRPE